MTDQPSQQGMSDDQTAASDDVDKVDVSVGFKRPGVVTFISIVLWIQAGMALVNAIALFLNRDDAGYQQVTGSTSDELLTASILEAGFAALLLLVGIAIWNGARWGRLLVAVVYGARLAVVGYYALTTLGNGVNTNALIAAGISIFVLWALYGNDKSDKYFEGVEQSVT